MQKTLIIAFVLITYSIISKSQISSSLPADSKPYGTTTYLSPDGMLWFGTAPLQYRGVYQKTKIDSLLALVLNNGATLNHSISGNAATASGLGVYVWNPSPISTFDYLFGRNVANEIRPISGADIKTALELRSAAYQDNGAITLNAGQWAGNFFGGDYLSGGINGFMMRNSGSGFGQYASIAQTQSALGIPSGGINLQTVTDAGNVTTNNMVIDKANPAIALKSGGDFSYLGAAAMSSQFIAGSEAGDVILRGANGVSIAGNSGSIVGIRINSSGNVGLGTTTPIAKLDVNGNGNFSGNITASKYVTNSEPEALRISYEGGYVSGFNNSGTSRNGFIQFNSDNINIVAESGRKEILLNSGGGGSVAIGKNTADATLDVNGTGNFSGNVTASKYRATGEPEALRISYEGGYVSGFNNSGTARNGFIQFNSDNINIVAESGRKEILLNSGGGGSVAIGKNTADATLDVNGTGNFSGNLSTTNDMYAKSFILSPRSTSNQFIVGTDHTSNFYIYDGTVGSYRMGISNSGNVGIGTTAPIAKLDVNGKIRAKEIKVENINWPDYVFTKSYQLPTLQETEKHIKEKGHLPGIPSAKEVKSNGIDLGEMNAKLLQKIEELTLHLIEKDKQLQKQNTAIKDQRDEIELLKIHLLELTQVITKMNVNTKSK